MSDVFAVQQAQQGAPFLVAADAAAESRRQAETRRADGRVEHGAAGQRALQFARGVAKLVHQRFSKEQNWFHGLFLLFRRPGGAFVFTSLP